MQPYVKLIAQVSVGKITLYQLGLQDHSRASKKLEVSNQLNKVLIITTRNVNAYDICAKCCYESVICLKTRLRADQLYLLSKSIWSYFIHYHLVTKFVVNDIIAISDFFQIKAFGSRTYKNYLQLL